MKFWETPDSPKECIKANPLYSAGGYRFPTHHTRKQKGLKLHRHPLQGTSTPAAWCIVNNILYLSHHDRPRQIHRLAGTWVVLIILISFSMFPRELFFPLGRGNIFFFFFVQSLPIFCFCFFVTKGRTFSWW